MKTAFKSFLLEDEDNITYKQIISHYEGRNLPKEEILKLPEPGPENFEGSYRVGLVYFNNERGLGSVPDNMNVLYKGFVAMLTPKEFLSLAASHRGREEAGKNFERLVGEGFPLGAPFIDIILSDIKDDGYATVVGHEGRGRCLALMQFAKEGKFGFTEKTKIPVHFFPRDGLRARHITDDMMKAIKDVGVIPEDENKTTPKFAQKIKLTGDLYVDGKLVQPK